MTDVPRPRLVPELAVSDLATSLSFWTDLAGFSLVHGRPEEGFALIERPGARVMLEQPDLAVRIWTTAPLERPYGRGINFEIDVDDLDAVLSRFAVADMALFMTPETKWYRAGEREIGVRQFITQDPDGYLLRFSTRIGERSRIAADRSHDPSRAT